MVKEKGHLIVISGPSGVGKGTLIKIIFKNIPNLSYSVSVTTRKPRKEEREGVDYFFVDERTFKKYIEEHK
ncbi:MAG: ATP-binding cassette domain-containing protein, partial [Atribacterota bacterium]